MLDSHEEKTMPNIYVQDLPKNDANFAALTPLLYQIGRAHV